MIRLYLLSTFCFAVHFVTAQHLNYTRYELLRADGLKISQKFADNQYDNIQGEAFLSAEWQHATAYNADGKPYDSLLVKLDTYANKLYVLINDTVYDLSASPVVRFQLYPEWPNTSTKAIFQKGFTTAGLKPEQYIEVLTIGKLILLKHRVLLIKEVHEDSFLATTKKFLAQEYYYVLGDDGEGESVLLNKSTLQRLTGNKWQEVGRYMKTKDLSPSNEEGWITSLSYYNTLK